jgi:hypothetical protein
MALRRFATQGGSVGDLSVCGDRADSLEADGSPSTEPADWTFALEDLGSATRYMRYHQIPPNSIRQLSRYVRKVTAEPTFSCMRYPVI